MIVLTRSFLRCAYLIIAQIVLYTHPIFWFMNYSAALIFIALVRQKVEKPPISRMFERDTSRIKYWFKKNHSFQPQKLRFYRSGLNNAFGLLQFLSEFFRILPFSSGIRLSRTYFKENFWTKTIHKYAGRSIFHELIPRNFLFQKFRIITNYLIATALMWPWLLGTEWQNYLTFWNLNGDDGFIADL